MTFSRRATRIYFASILTIFCTGSITFGQTEPVQIARNQPVSAEHVEEKIESKSPAEIAIENNKLSTHYLRRVGINATQTRSLTLNQAIKLALNNNNDIEIARDDVRIAELGLRSLLGTYDGVFSFAPNFNRNSTTGQTATKDIRVNSDFTQLIREGGGNYRVFFNNSRNENAFAQQQASAGTAGGGQNSALYSSSFGVTFTQPLFRDFNTDNTRRQIKIQRKRIAQSDADFRRRTIDIISQVQRAYWDLVFALRDQQNRVANLNLTKENLRQVEARISAGSAAPLQKAEVSTELANRESDVLLASQQVSIAENALKQLFLNDPNAPEWSESLVPTDSPIFNTDIIRLDDAVKDAIQNRPELSRLRLEKEVNSIDVDFFKNQTKPRLDLSSTFSLGGFASTSPNNQITTNLFTSQQDLLFFDRINTLVAKTQGVNPQIPISPLINPEIIIPASNSPIFGGYGTSLRNLFRSDSPSYSFGVTFSFPLRNRTAKANLASAKITEKRIDAQKRSQEQLIITEVRNAVQAVTTAQQRVLTARRARENAEIQLEGERKLYGVGRSTTFLLFQRENALTNARNSEIRAETDYNKALADLQKATSTTLSLNNVVVDSPMEDKDGTK